MKTVRDLAREIVNREGGYVNDPDDPGGATKHGVTVHTMRRMGMDLTRDGKVNWKDVQALSKDQAVDIFIEHYFHRPHVDALPDCLQPSVFDMYVNAGANAVRILQDVLNEMGQSVSVDGIIGPQTIQAARSAARDAPDHIADVYGIARRNYYYAIADRRPASRKYATNREGGKGGWIRRAEEFISPRHHLTDAEHRERVRAWG
ncbi:Secretion activator protein [Rhodovulum sp. P5]|uniref:holin-associated N-acetylmuramidase n=1 Tax=Rhodovulum sp. P5 TaxID=1564506 RepID=UPI0009C2ABB2|nr:holin-associated N-acetylmuramidase [Rhodovulum sp. P5]ARE42230.1 Secretion activator protein [Rhodovulum sp. P5]